MKFFFIIFCCATSALSYAQAEWNYLSSFPYWQPDITDMIVDDNAIIVFGDGFNNSIEMKQGLMIVRLDTTGHLIDSNFITDSMGDAITVSQDWGKIIKTLDGGYALTAAPYIRNSAFLIKLNYNLEVEFIKEYPDTINLSNFDYKLKEAPGGYLLFGSIQLPDYKLQGFVKYVDSGGDIIWERFYSNAPYGTRVLDLDVISDSLFVFVTVEALTPHKFDDIEEARSGIYKIDLKGNILGSWQSGAAPAIGYLRKVIARQDGSVITFGLARKKIVGPNELVQPTLAGFDEHLNMNWTRNVGNISSCFVGCNTIFKFAETIDGQYVGAGSISAKDGDEPSRGHGWLYKFSPNGDSIWGRSLPTPFPDYYPNGGTLYGAGVLPGGNIVAGGMARDAQNKFCWIVKLTNEGCMDTLFCQTVSIPGDPVMEAPGSVNIYPNPAQSYIRIESPEAVSMIEIADMLGRAAAVYSGGGQRGLRIDFPPGMPGGVYLAFIRHTNGKTVHKKIYIE